MFGLTRAKLEGEEQMQNTRSGLVRQLIRHRPLKALETLLRTHHASFTKVYVVNVSNKLITIASFGNETNGCDIN